MRKTKLSSKRQVVLPKALRDAQDWTAGTELTVEPVKDGILLRKARAIRPTTIEKVFGCLGRAAKPHISIEQMDEAVANMFREEYARGQH